ncbi:hypothetical protein ACFPYJ_31730 [Paenibacillus solisilvae]|uniref:Beta-hexosaminidase bacterial type N-terminal domain-containing protein n=1 Tax=Paenibacillus solisilvae TaxID=2486751 RepID=A0ABW0W8I3_9BACL
MQNVYLGVQENASPRLMHGLKLLTEGLQESGYSPEPAGAAWTAYTYREQQGIKIYVGNREESAFIRTLEEQEVLIYHSKAPGKEGFYLATLPGNLIVVSGSGDTGALYGAQELARQIRKTGRVPELAAQGETPEFTLRGPVLGLQKTQIEPPRRTYEYPITPERFPWFYDKDMWLDYLDMLCGQRSNVVYIWSGHPFASLVKLKDYPEALEVTEEEYRLNVETFHWLTAEADKRGIWVVLNFYNIHIPLPFAQKHGLELHQPKPLPITADYTRKSIAEFVRSYPNVGIMLCLGEALHGSVYGSEWFTETIIAGVKDGLKDLNVKENPPIILRAHAVKAEPIVEKALPLYSNLYTEAKYNGESLTTWTPRGGWVQTHNNLSAMQSVHIVNVHILANLEPFRYGAPSFIQKSMQASKHRQKANGLHVYPLFYWDWPYSADKVTPRLKQMDRDWIWYAAWARYAWNPDRDAETERYYWTDELAGRFGSQEAGAALLEAYDSFGECAPRILRRFGITEGNRQTMSLGMTMSQLTNPDKYSPYRALWEDHAPQGERLEEYALRETKGEPHIGETPLDVVEAAERFADIAWKAIGQARPYVTRNEEEFERIASDIEAIRYMVYSYGAKVRAAIRVLLYKNVVKGSYLDRVDILEEAVPYLKESLEWYRKLTDLTERTYMYANSMLTPHRKVPIPDGLKYKHWTDCLPVYETEFRNFAARIEDLKAGKLPLKVQGEENNEPYRQSPFKLLSPDAQTYTVCKNSCLFTDGEVFAQSYAEELEGLTGIRFSREEAANNGAAVEFEISEPARVLVGYFNSAEPGWLQVPILDENTHADDRGGLSPILRKGVKPSFYPSVNVHAFLYEAGRHTLNLGKGAFTILGLIPADQNIEERDVSPLSESARSLDWLYS